MKKIFVSYTTMSQEISVESLTKIKKVLKAYGEPYIELLDENSLKTQSSIIEKLSNSDLLLLLKTDYVYTSKWVQLELRYASNLNIPIVEIEPDLLLRSDEHLEVKDMLMNL